VVVVERAHPGPLADEGVVVLVAALSVRESDGAPELIGAVGARDARARGEERLPGVAEEEAPTELVLLLANRIFWMTNANVAKKGWCIPGTRMPTVSDS
jgi:hypothetical protein